MLLAFGAGPAIYAQAPALRSLTVKDGLASMTIYHLIQDREGLIWLATENGLNVYDGFRFRRLGVADGLPENDILGITEDHSGRIWTMSANGDLAFVMQDKVHSRAEAPWIPRLTGILKIHGQLQDGRLVFGTKNLLLAFDDQGVDTLLAGRPVGQILEQPGSALHGISPNGTVYKLGSKSHAYERVDTLKGLPQGWEILVGKYHGGVLNSTTLDQLREEAPRLTHAVLHTTSQSQQSRINVIFRSQDGAYWIGTNGNGIYLSRPGETRIQHYLEGHAISMFLEDRGGNIWISTLGQGLYTLPNQGLDILTFQQRDGLLSDQVQVLQADSMGNLFLGYARDGISCLRPDGTFMHHVPEMMSQGQDRITALAWNASGDLIAGTDHGSILIRAPAEEIGEDRLEDARGYLQRGHLPRPQARYAALFLAAVKDVLVLPDGTSLHNANGSVIRCPSEVHTTPCEDWRKDWGYALAWNQTENMLYIATQTGLLACPDTNCDLAKKHTGFAGRITCLLPDGAGGMWVGTSGGGLYHFVHGAIQAVNFPGGFRSAVVTALSAAGPGEIWVGTDQGLLRVGTSKAAPHPQILDIFARNRGLPDAYINAVLQAGTTLWVATAKGLTRLNLNTNKQLLPAPELKVSRVRISGKDTFVAPAYTLQHWQNSVSFSLWDACYTDARFQYRIEGAAGNWIDLAENEVNLPLLTPGANYKVECRAIGRGGQASQILSLQFHIRQVFYLTAWFWCLLGALVAAGLFGVGAFRRRARERLREREFVHQKKLAQVRLSALKSQMNPHFLFNSLNSIQHLIMENEGRSATQYVARFARLVRRVLDHSHDDFVLMSQELEMCQLYLDLESMRLLDNFSYEIICTPALNPHQTLFPAMSLQPFLENAIWHGLMPKASDRQLQVRIDTVDTGLRCVIEDNGIGREAAAMRRETQLTNHQSRAIAIFEERMALLNASFGDAVFSFRIIDLSQGTKVELYFPHLNSTPTSPHHHHAT